MKHIYLFKPFLIAYLLFAGCSPKETFYFSKTHDSFGHYKEKKQVADLPDNKDILAEPNKLNQPKSANGPIFTADNGSSTNSEGLILLRQTHSTSFNLSVLDKKVNIGSDRQVVKSKKLQKNVLKKYLDEPVDTKKVNGLTLVGFLLSLSFISLWIVPSLSLLLLVVLLGLIGSILSIFGLINIKKNPDKYSGKGFAWAGIIIGLLFTLFFVGFLLSFSGGV